MNAGLRLGLRGGRAASVAEEEENLEIRERFRV